MKRILICILSLLMSSTLFSQELKEYQWENRLIVVFSESSESKELQQQLELFKTDLQAFKERKLKLINAIPGKYRVILPEESAWRESQLYTKKKDTGNTFEVVLIGLDGGVKFRSSKPVSPAEFYRLIDSMPMRQAEMRRNNN